MKVLMVLTMLWTMSQLAAVVAAEHQCGWDTPFPLAMLTTIPLLSR